MRAVTKLVWVSLLLATGCLPESCLDCDENGDPDCVANNMRPSSVATPTPVPPPLTLQCASRNTRPEAELDWEMRIGGGSAPYTYTVDFDDGTAIHSGSWSGSGSAPRGTHEYERPGDYQVEGQVRDSGGRTASCTLAYAAPAPDLSLRCAATPTRGGVPLTVTFAVPPGGRRGCIGPCTVTWYFGDGESHEGGHAVHQYLYPGPSAFSTYAAFAELTDGLDRSATCRVPIEALPGPGDPQHPLNQPPSVDTLSASPAGIVAGQSATLTGTTSDPNPGDTVTWQLTFDTANAGTLSPMTGTGPILSTYASSPAIQGTVTVRALAVDNHGAPSAYRTVQIAVEPANVNDPPVIVSLTASPATIFAGGPATQITATITDPDNDPVTWTLALDPSSTATGTFSTTSGSGNVSATFSAALSPLPGTAVIRLTAQDPGGLTATRTVNVNVILG